MLTQLAQSGALAGAAAIVIGQLPRCDEPAGGVTGLSVFAEFLHAFPGPVIAGFATGHAINPLLTVPLGVMARVVAAGRPTLVLEEAAASA